MRKVLSFVLVLSLVLGSFGFAFAAPLSDIAGKDCEEAVNVLTELGVVQGYPDGSFKPEKVVTRAEMAVIVVSALGLEDYAVGTANFSDMKGHWSNGYVAYAASLGIIAGYPDGTFKPDQIVSYDEAAKMLVAALGYTPDSLVGTWPANYVVKAKTLGILEGVKSGPSGAVRGDIAVMTYQTLDQTIGVTNKDGDWTATTGDTMLVRLGATLVEDFVVDPSDVGNEDVTAVDLSKYVFAKLDVYTVDDVVIAVAKVVSDSVTGELDTTAKTVTDASDVEFSIASVATSTAVYFNGAEVDYQDVDTEFINGYDVTVYGTEDDEAFTAITGMVVWAPTAVQFAAEADLDAIEDAIEDGDGTVFGINLSSDDDELDMSKISVVGAVNSLDKIAEDDVVLVYAAGNDTSDSYVKFEVIRSTKDVNVTKKSTTKIYDGATAYEFASFNSSVTKDTLAAIGDFSVGSEYTLYLSADGKILYKAVIEEDNTELYGVVTGLDTETSFGTTKYLAKILTAGDEFVVYEVTDSTEYAALTLGALYTYEIDEDSVLVDSTIAAGALASDTYNSRTNSLDNLLVDADVVVFNISDADKTDWEVASVADGDVVTGAYIKNTDNEIVAIAYTASTGAESDDIYFVVNEIGEVKNASDNSVLEMVGFQDGVAKTVLSTSTLYSSSYLDDAPVIWIITYSGSEVSSTTTAGLYDASAQTVQAVGTTYVKYNNSIHEVDEDVVVYVKVYDDGSLDSYSVGDLDDIDVDDKVDVVTDSDGIITLLVVTNEADIQL